MEKISVTLEETSVLENIEQIENTLLVRSNNKYCLYNTFKKEFVSEEFTKRVIFDKDKEYFILFKDDGEMLIYDCVLEKYIVSGFRAFMVYGDYSVVVLLDDYGKKHLFDKYIFKTDTSIIERKFEKIERIYDDTKKQYYKVINDDGLYLYITGLGFISFAGYADIKYLCSHEDEIYFEVIDDSLNKNIYNIRSGFIGSIKYEDIFIDTKQPSLIYLQNEQGISVYDINLDSWLLNDIYCDHVKLVSSSNKMEGNTLQYGEYRFVASKDDIKELLNVEFNLKVFRKEGNRPSYKVKVSSLARNYNDIEYDEKYEIAFLKKGDKKGLFIKNAHFTSLIEPRYDDVKYLGDGIYELNRDNFSVIARLQVILKFLVNNCQVIDSSNYGIIYKIDEKYGLVLTKKTLNSESDLVIPAIYNSIIHLVGPFFEVSLNGKKGIYRLGDLIIPIQYDDICIKDIENNGSTYFSLKKESGEYDFATYKNDELSFLNTEFKNVIFFSDLMILKDEELIHFYDYKMNLIKSISSSIRLTMSKYRNTGNYIYSIGDEDYIFKNNALIKVLCKRNKLYIGVYESDYGYVVVNEYVQERFNEQCSIINSCNLEEFNKTLKSLNEKTLKLRPKD